MGIAYTFNPFTGQLDAIRSTPIQLTDINVSVDSPIILNNGSVIDFDFSTINTWTGTNTFNGIVQLLNNTFLDNNTVYFNIQDGDPLSANSAYLVYNSGNNSIDWSSNLSPTSVYFRIGMPLWVNNELSANNGYSIFGPDPVSIAPTDNQDSLVSIFSDDNSLSQNVKRAGLFTCEYIGSANTAHKVVGLNAFGHVETNYNLTSSNTFGGVAGGRYVVRHNGNGSITMATAVSAIPIFGANGTILEWAAFRAEPVTTAGSGTIGSNISYYSQEVTHASTSTMHMHADFLAEGVLVNNGSLVNRYGFKISEPQFAGTGNFQNQYGLFIGGQVGSGLQGATNNYEIWLAGDGGIYFNGQNQYIHSPSNGSLFLEANNLINLNQLVGFSGNVAMGSGTATIGSAPIGVSIAQNEWLEVKVDGNTRYIPLWA